MNSKVIALINSDRDIQKLAECMKGIELLTEQLIDSHNKMVEKAADKTRVLIKEITDPHKKMVEEAEEALKVNLKRLEENKSPWFETMMKMLVDKNQFPADYKEKNIGICVDYDKGTIERIEKNEVERSILPDPRVILHSIGELKKTFEEMSKK